jgi:hypothetical protein
MSVMTSPPPWAADPGSLTLTEAQYDGLPDHVRQLIEVIDGNVIFCPSGTPEHRDVTRTLAIRLDAARPAQPCTRVSTGVDPLTPQPQPQSLSDLVHLNLPECHRCLPRSADRSGSE